MYISLPILLILLGLLFSVFVYLWATYNAFIVARNKVKTDFADVDVQLKRRASLIANLVEVVRGYAKHERKTFENVAQARSVLDRPHSPKESEKISNMLTDTLKTLFAVSEGYPELQASKNYQKLQDDLRTTEDSITQYRETYNQSVLDYNTGIQIFPNLLVAGLFGFQEEEFFHPEPSELTDVKITPEK